MLPGLTILKTARETDMTNVHDTDLEHVRLQGVEGVPGDDGEDELDRGEEEAAHLCRYCVDIV